MDEKILSPILLDEAVAFLLVEPLYLSFWHTKYLPCLKILENFMAIKTPPKNYFFFPGTIASLAAFATRILTTVLAGILIVAPVAGLRPMRAF
jgi:hypothetical protein